MKSISENTESRIVDRLLNRYPHLRSRFLAIREFARQVRSSEYHLTNQCNLRCPGCWFFSKEFDKHTSEFDDLTRLDAFVASRAATGQTAALLIGGEPTLYPDRIRVFQKHLKYITISTNGLKRLPMDGFEDVAIAVTLFGGGALDDELRAVGPNGKRFTGLLARALDNYRNDPRACFIFAVCEEGIEHIEPTVQAIRANGNQVYFNYYVAYDRPRSRESAAQTSELLAETLRMCRQYPETVPSHPYFVEALITGRTPWGTFGYDTCPAISTSHVAHQARKKNGNPILPNFNSYAADMQTLNFCCTSGSCGECRDAHAVTSWLLVSFRHFTKDETSLRTWIEIAESYWASFIWSPFSRMPPDRTAQTSTAFQARPTVSPSHGVDVPRPPIPIRAMHITP